MENRWASRVEFVETGRQGDQAGPPQRGTMQAQTGDKRAQTSAYTHRKGGPMSQEQELRSFWRYIAKSVDEVLDCLEQSPQEWRNWRPGETANSLYVLATHVLGSTEFLVLERLCGENVNRQRAAEFAAEGTEVEPIREAWGDLQARVLEGFSRLPEGALDQERPFRQEMMTGREILLFAARHAAEHKGHAELTLDLITANQGQQPPLRQPRT